MWLSVRVYMVNVCVWPRVDRDLDSMCLLLWPADPVDTDVAINAFPPWAFVRVHNYLYALTQIWEHVYKYTGKAGLTTSTHRSPLVWQYPDVVHAKGESHQSQGWRSGTLCITRYMYMYISLIYVLSPMGKIKRYINAHELLFFARLITRPMKRELD